MPIHLSNLLGDLTLAQARQMVDEAEAAGGRGGQALFDILDPVREDERGQRREIKRQEAELAREVARVARLAKADQ